MSDGLLELLILGRIPGTDVYIDYIASLIIGAVLIILTVTSMSFRWYKVTAKRLARYSAEKLINSKTI